MKTITVGKHVFELVNDIPLGYVIWNIGKHMSDGYLPFCRLSSRQPFPGATNIEKDTLKAIKIDGAQTVLEALSCGAATITEMEQYIQHHRNAKPGSYERIYVQRCEKALSILRSLKRDA